MVISSRPGHNIVESLSMGSTSSLVLMGLYWDSVVVEHWDVDGSMPGTLGLFIVRWGTLVGGSGTVVSTGRGQGGVTGSGFLVGLEVVCSGGGYSRLVLGHAVVADDGEGAVVAGVHGAAAAVVTVGGGGVGVGGKVGGAGGGDLGCIMWDSRSTMRVPIPSTISPITSPNS